MKKKINQFLNNGYVVIDLLNKKEILKIEKQILKKINNSLNDNIIKNLRLFHKDNLTNKQHFSIFNASNRFIDLDKNIFYKKNFRSKIRKFLSLYWGHSEYKIFWIGLLKNNQILKNKAGFRVVRPNKNRESGVVHIDAFNKKFEYNKNFDSFITIWIPIIGLNKKYTLRYAKGSHINSHPRKKPSKKNFYNSNDLDKRYVKKYRFIRPQLKLGQGIVHHPNIIHGSSLNNGLFTRVSIEIRIFNSKKYSYKQIFNKKLYYSNYF